MTFDSRARRPLVSRALFIVCLCSAFTPGRWSSFTAADEPENAARLRASFEKHLQPFLDRHCVRCHQADKQTSGVRVDHLDAQFEEARIRLWEAIRKQIDDGVMPPEDEAQPTADEKGQALAAIDAGLDAARTRPTPKNGSVRRLTVAQYRNTLRELLLLDDDLTDVLPPDAVSRDGFLNNQETLQLSPLLLEAYLAIAEQALERSIVDVDKKPTIQSFRVDFGRGINAAPCPDALVLGANSLLLDNRDFEVTELRPVKSFAYEPFAMRTNYRFIEGYAGNSTVRGWRDYDSLYHAVFACMRGTRGYPKGYAYGTVPEGLLLRPAITSDEIFQGDGTYGPRANFKISLRELPDDGRFRVTVTAAKYDDGLLLDPGTRPQPSDALGAVVCDEPSQPRRVTLRESGIYQIDVHTVTKVAEPAKDAPTKSGKPEAKGEYDKPAAVKKPMSSKPKDFTLTLGKRHFSGILSQPAFLVVRLPAGELNLTTLYEGTTALERIVFTRLAEADPLAQRFAVFERRQPRVGVHLGLRRDCGSTLAPVGEPQIVEGTELARYVFEGALRNFPSPEVEKDNVNYLAGVREIGVRSENTDGRDMPRLLVRSVEFEGPFYDTWPPQSHRNIFIDSAREGDESVRAREIIARFATRAFRRPVTADEEASLVAVYQEARARGVDFPQGIKDALVVVLTSPQFLFLIENSPTPAAEPLDDYELASKLSYFLWNAPPDDRLLQLASQGKLRDSLESEVARMTADRRFGQFTLEFVSQWLSLDKLDVLERDRARFPKLNRDTRTQLRREPVAFVEYLIRENLPVRNLVASDFVVANEVVADYYGLAEKTESGFQFVPVAHGRAELGGVLGQAAILAGLSDGRESNPIKRGAWLARKIVAEPPADPPPNVPALTESTEKLTLRERLERHRNQPGCAQCHAKIDPWGMPLEVFDAGGRLKTGTFDARSTLPDQTEIDGVTGLRRYLADDRIDQVAWGFLKHLSTYACGRTPTYNELEFLKLQAVKLKDDGYRMQDLVRFVVKSPLFLEK